MDDVWKLYYVRHSVVRFVSYERGGYLAVLPDGSALGVVSCEGCV